MASLPPIRSDQAPAQPRVRIVDRKAMPTDQTAPGIAEAEPLDDMDRHRRQRHGNGEVGQKQSDRQSEDAAISDIRLFNVGHVQALMVDECVE